MFVGRTPSLNGIKAIGWDNVHPYVPRNLSPVAIGRSSKPHLTSFKGFFLLDFLSTDLSQKPKRQLFHFLLKIMLHPH